MPAPIAIPLKVVVRTLIDDHSPSRTSEDVLGLLGSKGDMPRVVSLGPASMIEVSGPALVPYPELCLNLVAKDADGLHLTRTSVATLTRHQLIELFEKSRIPYGKHAHIEVLYE